MAKKRKKIVQLEQTEVAARPSLAQLFSKHQTAIKDAIPKLNEYLEDTKLANPENKEE